MAQNGGYSDQELIRLLQDNKEQAIDLIFRTYYSDLCRMLRRIISDKVIVEDLAQDVFYELWRKREGIRITTSLKAYLKRAARNKALNYIRDQRMKFEEEEFPQHESKQATSLQQLEVADLRAFIHQTIDNLPERCRVIFSLSRFEEMSYQEIATELSISIKTVENQISKALRLLRVAMEQYESN